MVGIPGMLSWSSGFTAPRTLRVVFGGLSSPRVQERRTDLYDAAVEVLPVLRDHPEELRRHARGFGAIHSARQRDADAIEVLDADRVAPRNHKQRDSIGAGKRGGLASDGWPYLLPSSSLAAATTCSGSNPNFFCSSFSGAEAPNVFMPMTRPDEPT
jgi:hypothetical protein